MNTSYTIHELRNILDVMESKNTPLVSLKELEKQLVFVPLVNSIASLIKAKADAYLPIGMREQLMSELSVEGYIQEIIPSICLGRCSGHSTAVAKFVQDNPNEHVIVVVPHAMLLEDYRRQFNIPLDRISLQNSAFEYNSNIRFVTQTDLRAKLATLPSSKKDPLIIVESDAMSQMFLKTLSPELLIKRLIVVGN